MTRSLTLGLLATAVFAINLSDEFEDDWNAADKN